MLRLYPALAFIAAGLGTAQAAECTTALQSRWEGAMAEAMQLQRILVTSKSVQPDTATLCRIVKNATELSAAGKDYFPACDPLDSGRRRIVITKMEEMLAKTDTSPCLKPMKARSGKKT